MAIGPIHKGAFHRWLGKKPGTPITDADIAKGIKAGGHPAKMAEFAKSSRKFRHAHAALQESHKRAAREPLYAKGEHVERKHTSPRSDKGAKVYK